MTLSDPERQAHFPEKGTRFETLGTAEIVASTLLQGKMNWRVESLEEQFVVRIWSIMSSPISESRRWMKVRKPHTKRKPNGDQEK